MCIAYFLGRVSPLWLLEFGRMFFVFFTCPSHPSARHGVDETRCQRSEKFRMPSKLDLPGCLVCHRGLPTSPLFCQSFGFLSILRTCVSDHDVQRLMFIGNCWHRTVMGLMSTYTSSRSSWHNSWRGSSGATFAASCLLELEYPFHVMYTLREPPSTGNLTSLTSLRSYTFNASGWDAIRWCSSQGKRHKSRSAEKCGHAVRSSWDCRWNQMFFSNCPFLFCGPVSSLSLWPSDPGNFLSI